MLSRLGGLKIVYFADKFADKKKLKNPFLSPFARFEIRPSLRSKAILDQFKFAGRLHQINL